MSLPPSPAPLPLAAHRLMSHRDPALAELDTVRRCGVEGRRISVGRDAAPFLASVNGVTFGGIQLFGVAFTDGARVCSEPLHSFHLMLPVSGALGYRGTPADSHLATRGSALMFCPRGRVELEWQGQAVAWGVRIPLAVLARFLAESCGVEPDGPPRFRTWNEPGDGVASLTRVLGGLFAELEDPRSLAHAGSARQWRDLLLMTLLGAIPNSAFVPGGTTASPVSSRRLRKVIDYIIANAERELGMSDLVAVAGGSARALQAAFHAHFGVGPMTWVRNHRLDRVRRELQHGVAGSMTVADAAARWGFFNASHFSQLYRRRYGVPPSADVGSRA